MRPIRVLFDLDDTLTDFIVELVGRYNKKYNTNHTINDCYKWELNEIFEHNILELIDDEDFFESVKPKGGAVELIRKLHEDDAFDVYVITSCLKPENYIKKIDWFNKHMPFFPVGRVVPLTDKHIVRGDILVDDRPKNLEKWLEENKNGVGLLVNVPHNRLCDKFWRIERLNEIEAILSELKKIRNFS